MEIYDIAEEIQGLCRKIIATDQPVELDRQCSRLRALLREHSRITHDQASSVLVRMLDAEYRLRQVS